jgi:hypothetical protein
MVYRFFIAKKMSIKKADVSIGHSLYLKKHAHILHAQNKDRWCSTVKCYTHYSKPLNY